MLKQEKDLKYLCVADCLLRDYPAIVSQLQKAIGKENVGIIPGCQDYWVRDFMPLNRRDGRLLSFTYRPDYVMRKLQLQYITNQQKLLDELGWPCDELRVNGQRLVLDGGNVVVGDRHIFICDKALLENEPVDDAEDFKHQLKEQLGGDIVFLPWNYTVEALGHADGYVNYLGKGRVMMTHCEQGSTDYGARLWKTLRDAGFDVVEFQLRNRNQIDWAYMNVVQWRDLILMPAFGLKGDAEAQAFIAHAMELSEEKVIPIRLPHNLVERYGGAIHCLTWNSDRKPAGF